MASSHQIKAIVFDIGGVLASDVWEHMLLDPEKGVSARYSLDPDLALEIGERLFAEYAYQIKDMQAGWQKLEQQYWQKFIAQTGLSVTAEELIALTDAFIHPITGMTGLLQRIRNRGLLTAICSNNTEFWYARQQRKLDLYKFVQPQNIVLSSRVGASKSSEHYEMFQEVIHRLGVPQTECIFIDDRIPNIENAVQFGFISIQFPSHSVYGSRYTSDLLEAMGVL